MCEQVIKMRRTDCILCEHQQEREKLRKYHCYVEKYQDLGSEVRGICVVRTRVITFG